MSLIHRYQSNGYNIVLDINSGCIHLVDEVTYEVLPYLEEGMEADAIAEKLGDRFKKEDVETSVTECKKLKEQGMLFTKDIYENIIDEFTKNRQTVVKALCLHIAHDCNLACRYCFAEEGELLFLLFQMIVQRILCDLAKPHPHITVSAELICFFQCLKKCLLGHFLSQ